MIEMISVFILLVRECDNIKSPTPNEIVTFRSRICNEHLTKPNIWILLPSSWCNTILICKLVIFQRVDFLLEGSRWRPHIETTAEPEPIRNTVPHEIYYLKTLFIQAMFAEHECVFSPTPWILFRQLQTHLGAARTPTELLILANHSGQVSCLRVLQ